MAKPNFAKLLNSARHRMAKRMTNDRWEPRKCIWPYPEGYATYNPKRRMVLDTGLTKERAQEICDEMNKEPS